MRLNDPVTVAIIQSTLLAVSDEMFAVMKKTAMSAIIYEVLDMGTGVTDAHGNLASSGAGIPAFVGVLDKAVRRVAEIHNAPGAISAGDVFVTNDPHYGGVTHLNDMVLVMPVFFENELVAWTANIAHWNDVGGMIAGSMSPEATEIFQEGLRLPAVKLISRGEPNEALIKTMKVNSRMPDFLEGDLWAGVAAVRIGAKRIIELVAKYGRETFLRAVEDFMHYGEQVSLKALSSLPKGSFEVVEEQDSGAIYRATVTITETEFIVDLRDNPDQDEGPNNASRDGTMTSVQMIFKNITDAGIMCNGGTFRPIQLLTRPGSVFDANERAAFAIYYEVEIRLYDLIWRGLAEHLGCGLPAGHFSSICGTLIGGVHPDTGKHFSVIEPQVGGWGASSVGDGNSAVFSGVHGETYNCPAEIAESRYGLYVDRLALNRAPGGEGRFRGGRGILLDYRVRSNECFLTASFSRHKHLPWSLRGGHEGSSNAIEIIRADGAREHYSIVTGLALHKDDVIRIRTGNGGGFGDPRARDRVLIDEDIRNGYISEEVAENVYGVTRAEG